MQETEKSWPKNKKETREDFLKRLRKTAMSLPTNVVHNMIKDLKPRCQRLYDANGGNIEEGVKAPKKKGGK